MALGSPTAATSRPDIDGWIARNVVFHVVRFLGVHVFTLRSPIGRKASARRSAKGDMLVRVKPKWLEAAGVTCVGRTIDIRDGKPVVEDGRGADDVTNVMWCVGFRQDLSWIDLPIFGEDGRRCTSAASSRASRACTSWGCRSSSRSRRT